MTKKKKGAIIRRPFLPTQRRLELSTIDSGDESNASHATAHAIELERETEALQQKHREEIRRKERELVELQRSLDASRQREIDLREQAKAAQLKSGRVEVDPEVSDDEGSPFVAPLLSDSDQS